MLSELKALKHALGDPLASRDDLPMLCASSNFASNSTNLDPQLRTNMAKMKTSLQFIEPIGPRVLVLKDEPKRETKGGIALPDAAEIPTITGRIVTISKQVSHNEDVPLRQYDKVLFHPKNAIPVDFESDNQLFVVPVDDIVAVFRKDKPEN